MRTLDPITQAGYQAMVDDALARGASQAVAESAANAALPSIERQAALSIFDAELAHQKANGGEVTPRLKAYQDELQALQKRVAGKDVDIAYDSRAKDGSWKGLSKDESDRANFLYSAVNGGHKTWLSKSGIVPAAALIAIAVATAGASGAFTPAAGGASTATGAGGFSAASPGAVSAGGLTAGESALGSAASANLVAAGGSGATSLGTAATIGEALGGLSSWTAPLRLAGTAIQGAGALMQDDAAKKAQKTKDALYQEQATLQGQEFDKRALAASSSDITAANLSREGFGARQKLQSDANQLLSKETVAQIQRDSTSDDDYYDTLHQVLGDQTTAQHSARGNYDAIVAAENANQATARQAADARVGSLVSESGVPTFEADRAGATAGRMSLAESLMAKPTAPEVLAPASSAAFDAATSQAETRAGRTNTAGANLNSYADATAAGTRRIDTATEDLGVIDRHARATASNLPTALAVPQTGYAQANTRADEQRTVAANNQTGGKAISAAQYARNTVPAKYYSDTIDTALADYYKSRLSSEDTYTKQIIGSSNDYQSQNAAITDRKIANTRGTSTLGDYFTGIGSMMGSGVSYADIGDSYKKIAAQFG